MAESLHDWIRKNFRNGRGGVRLLELPLPENLAYQCTPDKVPRLAVAVGLSLPAELIPQVMLPHEIDDAPPTKRSSDSDRYIDKSMV